MPRPLALRARRALTRARSRSRVSRAMSSPVVALRAWASASSASASWRLSFSTGGVLGEDGEGVAGHLAEAAVEEVAAVAALGVADGELAESELGDEWGAAREDAHEAVVGGDGDVGRARVREAGLGGDQTAAEALGHGWGSFSGRWGPGRGRGF